MRAQKFVVEEPVVSATFSRPMYERGRSGKWWQTSSSKAPVSKLETVDSKFMGENLNSQTPYNSHLMRNMLKSRYPNRVTSTIFPSKRAKGTRFRKRGQRNKKEVS